MQILKNLVIAAAALNFSEALRFSPDGKTEIGHKISASVSDKISHKIEHIRNNAPASMLSQKAAVRLAQKTNLKVYYEGQQDPDETEGEEEKETVYFEESGMCVRISEMLKGLPDTPTTPAPHGNPLNNVAIEEPAYTDTCYEFCRNHTVMYMAMKGDECYCFDQWRGEEISDDDCDHACPGKAAEHCGGSSEYSVHLMLAWIPKPRVMMCPPPPEMEGVSEICAGGGHEENGEIQRTCNVTCGHGFLLAENTLFCDTSMGTWIGNANCQEITCGGPPRVENSLSVCASASAVGTGGCEVKCMPGTELEGNSLKCTATENHPTAFGFYEGVASCMPKSCGVPPDRSHTLSMLSEAYYPQQVRYTCEHGFSLNADPKGVLSFFSSCKEDGTLEAISEDIECKPVKCGEAPTIEHSERIEGTDGQIEKTLVYPEQAKYMCGDGYSADGFGSIKEIAIACEPSALFSHVLECLPTLCGMAASLPHAKSLRENHAEPVPYKEDVGYRCDEGYELPSGTNTFSISCEDDGTFHGTQVCQAVSCGIPPVLANAMVSLGEAFFPAQLVYSCAQGYTVNGHADGHDFFDVHCQSNREFSELGACRPVACPPVPSMPHAALTQESATATAGGVFFPMTVDFRCEDGFSLDMTDVDAAKMGSVSCLHTGQYTELEHCQEIDDCIGHSCGPFGHCVDHHMNYTCNCLSGYASHLIDNEIICGNVDDCGPSACGEGGVCEDLVNDYTCHCDRGFEMIEADGEKMCSRVECGIPEVMEHTAELEATKAVFQDQVHYHCEEGFTLTGHADGEAAFVVQCLDDATFTAGVLASQFQPMVYPVEPMPEIVPPRLLAAGCAGAGDPRMAAANEVAAVRCCTPDGAHCESGGPIGCLAGQTFQQAEEACAGAHLRLCTQEEAESQVCCDTGCNFDSEMIWTSSLSSAFMQHRQPSNTTQHLAVASLLQKQEPVQCKAVECADKPTVPHATADSGDVVFPNMATYRCAEGYTIDGHPDGIPMFEIGCTATGHFLEPQHCLPVTCGPPVGVDMAHVDLEPKVFGQETVYECMEGYATDPKNPSARQFTASCQADGNYVGVQRCFPVRCHLPEIKTGVNAEYFFFTQGEHMPDLAGRTPDLVRVDQKMDWESTDGAWEGVPQGDNFAARWTGSLLITLPGFYEFELESDDGSFLYLDGGLSVGASEPGADATSFFGRKLPKRIGGVSGSRKTNRHKGGKGGLALLGSSRWKKSVKASKQASLGHRATLLSKSNHTQPFIDNDGTHTMTKVNGGRDLTSGPHELYLEYFEKSAGAGFKFRYRGPDTLGQMVVVPEYVLEPPDVTYAGPPTIMGHGSDASFTHAFFPQQVSFACKPGYTINGDPIAATTVVASCDTQGQLEGVANCQPVQCLSAAVPEVAEATSSQVPASGLTYGEVITYSCAEGFAVEESLTDKLLLVDTGDLSNTFGVECLSTGLFSAPKVCKNVDDCGGHSCGPHGSCVDGIASYSCACESGFEPTVLADGEHFCGNVDDCGPDACGSHGTCIDLVNSYHCECFSGYESIAVGESDHVCEAKTCPELPAIEHSSMEMAATLSYPNAIQIECQEGHSIDGTVLTEAMSFTVECQQDGTHTPPSPCVPVECGFAPSVFQVATAPEPTRVFKFSEMASYSCAEGHSLDGTAAGARETAIVCGANGMFPPVSDCMPLTCGNPERMLNGGIDAVELFYPGVVTYAADSGYTLNNDRPLEVTFQRHCQASGELTPIPDGLLEPACEPGQAATVGPTKIELELVTCNKDLSETDTGAEFSFEVNGAWTEATPLAQIVDRMQALHVDVELQGFPTKFKIAAQGANKWCYKKINLMHCDVTLAVLTSAEPEQGDNNHWVGVADGVSASHVFDVPPPPVATVLDFFSATMAQTNLGGAGPDSGVPDMRYANIGNKAGQALDLVVSTHDYQTGSHEVERPGLNGKFGQISVNAGHKVALTFTFVEHGTDTPVELDMFDFSFFHLGRSPRKTSVVYAREFEQYFSSEDFEYEIEPAAEGFTGFRATEQARGCHRPEDPDSLGEVSCSGMEVDQTKRSVMFSYARRSSFDIVLEVTCDRGRCDGARNILFAGRSSAMASAAEEDSMPGVLKAVRVSCGRPPRIGHASNGLPGRKKFGEMAVYDCDPGHTIDGSPQGLTDFAIQCQADGQFTAAPAESCQMITYRVEGRISDATNMDTLSGAQVVIKQGDLEITRTTNNRGAFDAEGVPSGDVEVVVTKDGYINAAKELHITGSVSTGAGADISMSPVLPPDGWRVVLTWEASPRDLDSHFYFEGSSCHMYWARRHVSCGAFGGVSATLDVDDVSSYGPETSTIMNLNSCQGRSSCNIVFKVHNYSRRPGWAESAAVVKLYNGMSEVGTYHVGTDGVESGSGRRQYWSVFKLDGLTGQVTTCDSGGCS